MGMDAYVIGIGPLTKEILDKGGLEYSSNNYDGTPLGTVITSTFFHCNTTSQSMELANILGVGDRYNFADHSFNKETKPELSDINAWIELLVLAESTLDNEYATKVRDTFYECFNTGWIFFYRPDF